MTLLCPKCQTQLSFWSNGNDKPFPCPSCGIDIKITCPPLPFAFWFVPPIIDVIFAAQFYARHRKVIVVSLAEQLSATPAPPPEKSSFEEIKKSAQTDDADAQVALGGMYFTGEGCERNFEEAYFWHSLAVKSGKPKDELEALKRYLSAGQIAVVEKRVAAWITAHAVSGRD